MSAVAEEVDSLNLTSIADASSSSESAHILHRTDADIRQAIKAYKCNPNNMSKYGDIENWDTQHVTDMSRLFERDKTFNADISKWNVSNVTNMSNMFDSTHLMLTLANGMYER